MTDPLGNSSDAMSVSKTVTEKLAEVAVAPDRGVALESILANLDSLSNKDYIADDLSAIGQSLLADTLGIVTTRSILDTIISTLKSTNSYSIWRKVGTRLLECLSGTIQASFLDQVAVLCDLVATAYESEESFEEAAKILARIPLDNGQRRVSQEDKARVWVRIVRDFLEVDDSTSAESYLNKLKTVIHDVDNHELNLHFKLSQARINDAKREFLSASTIYHDISYSLFIAEEERLHTLGMAIRCAILAPAGPTRSRVLGRLYKDERTLNLEDFSILEKMFLNRLLTPTEVFKFSQSLQPHQLATTSDGSNVLAKAMVDHNLLGVSRLYRNIRIDDLAFLLGLEASKAEEAASNMIEQGRLLGRIDQIDGLVWFEGGDASGEKGSGRAEGAVDKELRQWDTNVQNLAEEIESVTNRLQQAFPVSDGLVSKLQEKRVAPAVC